MAGMAGGVFVHPLNCAAMCRLGFFNSGIQATNDLRTIADNATGPPGVYIEALLALFLVHVFTFVKLSHEIGKVTFVFHW